jgi:hypothetical protein
MSRLARLAEGETLWSNLLCVIFQRLRITYHLVNLWETADSLRYLEVGRCAAGKTIFDPDLE